MKCVTGNELWEKLLVAKTEDIAPIQEEIEKHLTECEVCQHFFRETILSLQERVPNFSSILNTWQGGATGEYVEFPFGCPPIPEEKQRGFTLWKMAIPAVALAIFVFLLSPFLFRENFRRITEFPGENLVNLQGTTMVAPIPGFQKLFFVIRKHEGDVSSIPLPSETIPPLRSTIDYYRFVLELRETGYLYIFQYDSQGKLTRLFPHTQVELTNPLTEGKTYVVPGEKNWFFLDETRGEEQIIFIFSPTPREDLENTIELSGERGREKARVLFQEGFSFQFAHQ